MEPCFLEKLLKRSHLLSFFNIDRNNVTTQPYSRSQAPAWERRCVRRSASPIREAERPVHVRDEAGASSREAE